MALPPPVLTRQCPEPPFNDPPITPERRFSLAWAQYFTDIKDWMEAVEERLDALAARHQIANSVAVALTTGTSATSYIMQGFGLTFTPSAGMSRVSIIITGEIANSINNGEAFARLFYGTGTPPATGAPQTGTPIGSEVHMVATSGGGSYVPFSQNALLTGLTPGVTYWVDLAVHAAGTGIASVSNVQLTGISLMDQTVF